MTRAGVPRSDVLKPAAPEVGDVNRNDRAITGLVMVAHAMVHTYELSLPLLLPVWQAEFTTLGLPSATEAGDGDAVPASDVVPGQDCRSRGHGRPALAPVGRPADGVAAIS
jgi:hypothetical protein